MTIPPSAPPVLAEEPGQQSTDLGWTKKSASPNQQQEPEPVIRPMSATRRVVAQVRLRLGTLVLGRGWTGYLMWAALVQQRARECVTPDGQVILARCEPLADALYRQVPGEWSLTITHTVDV